MTLIGLCEHLKIGRGKDFCGFYIGFVLGGFSYGNLCTNNQKMLKTVKDMMNKIPKRNLGVSEQKILIL